MAKEEKKEARENVDAEDLRVKKEGESNGRGETTASTEQNADKAKVEGEGKIPEPKKPVEPKKPAEPEKPAEPDWKTLYALTLADFDNYKKRAARDREDTYRFAEADILKDVLPTVDNLALALANVGGPRSVAAADGTEPVPPDAKHSSFVQGVQLVYDALLKALKDHGAEPFDSLGKELDPEKMEAIATLPSPDYDEGKVSTEVKRGWMLKDKLLRAAQVVVSSGKPPAPEPPPPESK